MKQIEFEIPSFVWIRYRFSHDIVRIKILNDGYELSLFKRDIRNF